MEDFQVGVAALDTDQTDLSRRKLSRAIEQIPQEPAAWADRGLMYLRNNQQNEAAADLEHSYTLAPQSAEIEALLGLLAKQQGRFADAASHYRKVIAGDPRDLASRFALAQVVAQEGGPNSDAEYQRLMGECLQIQPHNLFVLHERGVAAASRGDRAALNDTLDHYRTLAPGWSAEARTQLEKVAKAAGGPLPGQIVPELHRLDNLLKGQRGYTNGALAVQPSPGRIGRPLYHFLVLPPPPASPAPADLGLAFTEQPGAWKAAGPDRSWGGAWAPSLTGFW